MSAVPVVTPTIPRPGTSAAPKQRWLRLVPQPRARMARLPFLTLLIVMVAAGMVGLLLLNTSLQNQAFQASQLRRQAAEMSYAVGELEGLLTEAESTRELSRKATALGMRPNRDIAFVEVPTGVISGEPRASDGLYLPSALTRTPEEVAKERADQAMKRSANRRTDEQAALQKNRQRIIDARAKELEQRRLAAEEKLAAERAAAAQAGAPAAAGQTEGTQTAPAQPGSAPAGAAQNQAPQNAPAQPAPAQNAQGSENR